MEFRKRRHPIVSRVKVMSNAMLLNREVVDLQPVGRRTLSRDKQNRADRGVQQAVGEQLSITDQVRRIATGSGCPR